MQAWKRRLAFVLAVGTGAVGLTLSSAGAQTPPDFPTFPTFPTFPDFPTIPSTSPPPTMPPPTTTSTSPPPTMPPPTTTITTPPPTMPPSTSPPSTTPPGDLIDDFFDSLEGLLEEGADDFEEFRDAVNELIAELFG